MLKTALGAAAIACALCTAAATAAPGQERAVTNVGYDDLDLGTSAGRAKLQSRIHWAAARVCADYERPAPTGLMIDRNCFQAAKQDALRQMDQRIARHRATNMTAVASGDH